MTADRDVEAVAAVLGAHHCDYRVTNGRVVFTCGFASAFEREQVYALRNAQDAHLAAALLPLIREREAAAWERALSEAAEKWQWGEWTVLTKPINASDQPQRIIGAAQAVTDWLRDRAAALAEPGDQSGEAVDWARVHHGICPKCREEKFIGHGPLCIDCFAGTSTTTAQTAENGARIDSDGPAGRNREIPCADGNEAQSGAERTRGSE